VSCKQPQLHPEEIRSAKHEILDVILQEVTKLENYWRYRHRELVGMGLGITFETTTNLGEVDNGLMVVLNLRIFIPKELWIKVAQLKKTKRFKLPKPHPVTRQRYREMEKEATAPIKEIQKELSTSMGGYNSGEKDGKGD